MTNKVATSLRAEGQVDDLPAGPLTMTLDRITFPAGAVVPPHTTSGIELIVVERGDLSFIDELGIEGAYAVGGSVLVPDGGSYGVSNASTRSASELRLSIGTSAPDQNPGDVMIDRLFEDQIENPPSGPGKVFLMRSAWAAQVRSSTRMGCGPIVLFADSGGFSISGDAGSSSLNTGEGALLPLDGAHRIKNESKKSSNAILAGVIPVDGTACLPPPPATATPTRTATPKPKPTATATPVDSNPIIVPGSGPPDG